MSWAFVSWEVFNHGFTFSACDWSVCIFYFFLVQSRDTYLSKNLSMLFRLSILLAYICSLCLCSVMSDSLRFHRFYLCPWDFKGKNTRVSCHFFLQGIFLTQGSNPHLLYPLHWQQIIYHQSHLRNLHLLMIVSYDPWYFCDLSCNFFLYSNFTDLSPLPFFHSEEKDKDLSFFSIFSKNNNSVLLICIIDFFLVSISFISALIL